MSLSDRSARRLPDRWEALSTFRKQRQGKKTAATVCATCARKGSTGDASSERRAASGEQFTESLPCFESLARCSLLAARCSLLAPTTRSFSLVAALRAREGLLGTWRSLSSPGSNRVARSSDRRDTFRRPRGGRR